MTASSASAMTNTGPGKCATRSTPIVERGGHVARFAGNFMWQTRLEDEGRRQVCYKYRARAEDPIYTRPATSPAPPIPGKRRKSAGPAP